MDHIRIGIIGAGQISKSCCNGVAHHDAASVVAVADMNAERLNELCDEFSIENAIKHTISSLLMAISMPSMLRFPTSSMRLWPPRP